MLLSPDRIYFIFFVFAVAFLFHFFRRNDVKLIILGLANIFFYASISIGYFLLHIAIVLIAYRLALSKDGWIKKTRYPALLAAFILLTPLLFFKAGIGESLLQLTHLEKQKVSWTAVVQWVPIGLSFYTFALIGYVVDVYKGYTAPEKNFWRLMVFAGFFPAILAGPIERSRTLLQQLRSGFEQPSITQLWQACLWIVWGLFKKLVIANNIAAFIDPAFYDPHSYSTFTLYFSSLFFIVQIFMDFSAYSDIAVGAAGLLGLQLIPNFHPALLLSSSRLVFWRRWHISLTNWFREYVYFPLASGEKSAWFHYFNTSLVFLLTGLWHGLSIAFALWGLINAASLIVEQQFIKWRKKYFASWEQNIVFQKFYILGGFLVTIHVNAFAGLLFRLETMGNFVHFLHAFGHNAGVEVDERRNRLLILVSLGIYALISRRINTSNPKAYQWMVKQKYLPFYILFLMVLILYFKNETIKYFYYYRF